MQSVNTQMPSVDMLLTAETAPAYANGVGALDGASHAVEVDGGNLNYAFRVSCADGNSIFLKQTPGFVKARLLHSALCVDSTVWRTHIRSHTPPQSSRVVRSTLVPLAARC